MKSFQIRTVDSPSEQVEAYFRKAIAEQHFKPGERLPSNQALAREFNVSATVIQNALSRLAHDGLLERKRKKGTFVRKFQEKANIALLFGDSLTDETAHYYRAVLNRFQEGCAERKWGCRHWGALNAEMFPAQAVEQRSEQILREHRSHPFSAVIEFSPGKEAITPEELKKTIPVVSYGSNRKEVELHSCSYSFGLDAARCLGEAGRRNLFYFCTVWHNRSYTTSIDGLMDGAARLGLPSPRVHVEPYATQGYEMELAMYHRMTRLIDQWKRTSIPDGLVVNDDIVMRAVAPALLKAGIAIPSEMTIFCHGNEDVRFHYGFPVIRSEVSPGSVAGRLLEALEARIEGRPAQPGAVSEKRTLYYEHD
ncbi:MAG TPA: GntR family transcriptional regulator [Chthoniobacteraceae bacterium]|nr:GntR family transcriptional regulator [Chthoniobacteraceae bacterium]